MRHLLLPIVLLPAACSQSSGASKPGPVTGSATSISDDEVIDTFSVQHP